MDNQEAIKTLRELCRETNDSWYEEVYDKAISALQAQETLDINVGDMISIQESIDTNGLDEEVRCAMCRNQMKTDRGCDGNCKYDEKLYEKIMQILYERIKPLSPAQPKLLSDAYTKAVWTWLLDYQIKAAELKGRYAPYEVLSWVANDWRKEHE